MAAALGERCDRRQATPDRTADTGEPRHDESREGSRRGPGLSAVRAARDRCLNRCPSGRTSRPALVRGRPRRLGSLRVDGLASADGRRGRLPPAEDGSGSPDGGTSRRRRWRSCVGTGKSSPNVGSCSARLGRISTSSSSAGTAPRSRLTRSRVTGTGSSVGSASQGSGCHDLRHAYATALLTAGVHPKVASEALGHSSVSFTMDTYQHLMPTMQDAATRAIEEALGSALSEERP